MKILLVNDDGVRAPGINALYEVLKDLGEVVVVAPMEERSTTGHSLSLAHPLRLVEVAKNQYGVNGFPADCVLMGFGAVFGERPDLVISGINRGGNLGQDIFYSGTVAAAREASFHRVPSLAVSLTMEFSDKFPMEEDYYDGAKIVRELVERKIYKYLPPLHLFNINIPFVEKKKIKGLKITTVGLRKYSDQVQRLQDPRSREYFWVVGKYEGFEPIPESDCWAINEGHISLSPLAPADQKKELSPACYKIIEEFNESFCS